MEREGEKWEKEEGEIIRNTSLLTFLISLKRPRSYIYIYYITHTYKEQQLLR